MAVPVTKEQIIERIRTERAGLEAAIAGLSEQQCLLPGAAGHYSVKDILAHVTWWELHALEELNRTADPVNTGADAGAAVDRINQSVYEEHRDQPFEQILAASHASFQRVVESLAGFTEDHLLANLEDIAGDTYGHYHEHAVDINGWRSRVNAGR